MAHPAWLLTHAVTRPVYRMRTVSIVRLSESPRRYFRVKPSSERVSRATGRTPSRVSAASLAATFAGSSVMASSESAISQYR